MSDFPPSEINWEVLGGPERVRVAVEKGGGYTSVVRRSGISPSSLNEYLKGRVLRVDTALRLASACGVSPQWLVFGDGAAEERHMDEVDARTTYYEITAVHGPEKAQEPDIVWIPEYDVAASAGFGSLSPDTPPSSKIAISRHFLSSTLSLNPNHVMILQVAGSSMEPTMASGDRVIVNTQPVSILDGLCVFVSGGQLMVKRLAVTSRATVRIISDNEKYPTEEVPVSKFRWGKPEDNETITILGRVAYRLQALS